VKRPGTGLNGEAHMDVSTDPPSSPAVGPSLPASVADAGAKPDQLAGLIPPVAAGRGVLDGDKLGSYQVAHRELMSSVEHRRSRYLNSIGPRTPISRQNPGTGDETPRLTWAGPTVPVCVQPHPTALSSPSSSDQRTPMRTEMTNRFAVWDEIRVAAAA
jgi:hypothetical protein